MKIYLVGFMGAGKTTVRRELAARIDAPQRGGEDLDPLHRAILDDPRFIAGDFSTRFMETFNR